MKIGIHRERSDEPNHFNVGLHIFGHIFVFSLEYGKPTPRPKREPIPETAPTLMSSWKITADLRSELIEGEFEKLPEYLRNAIEQFESESK